MARAKGRTWRKRLLRAAVALLIATPPAMVALWLLVHHVPTWYRPQRLDPVESRRAQADATDMFEWISSQMVAGRPFEVVLRDASVNEWLAVLAELWPEAGSVLPPELREFAVCFSDGRIAAGSHFERDGWQAILSTAVVVSIPADGVSLSLRVERLQAGGLNLPRAILRRLLDPAIAGGRGGRRESPLKSADDLFSGLLLPNRFVWPNGDRPFRIASIVVEEGLVRIGVEPQRR